jgi:hypothetical protein
MSNETATAPQSLPERQPRTARSSDARVAFDAKRRNQSESIGNSLTIPMSVTFIG